MLGDPGCVKDNSSVVSVHRLFIFPWMHVNGEQPMSQQKPFILALSNKVGHLDFCCN